MKCPVCNGATDVIESRPFEDSTRRRRVCARGHRFSTVEVVHVFKSTFSTPENLQRIIEMREAGATWMKVAIELGCDLKTATGIYAKHKRATALEERTE